MLFIAVHCRFRLLRNRNPAETAPEIGIQIADGRSAPPRPDAAPGSRKRMAVHINLTQQRLMKTRRNRKSNLHPRHLDSSPYHQSLALAWLANAMERIDPRSEEAEKLIEWIEENALRLCEGLNEKGRELDQATLVEAVKTVPVEGNSSMRRRWRRDDSMDSDAEEAVMPLGEAWRNLRKHIERLVEATEDVGPDRMHVRLQELAKIARLSPEDVTILEFVALYETQSLLESLVDSIGGRFGLRKSNGVCQTLPCFLGMNAKTIGKRLTVDAPLIASGLLSIDSDGDIDIASRLKKIAWAPEEEMDVRRLLLDASAPTELDWSDFDHFAADRDMLEKILAGALRKGSKGVNILLYGPNGTGKTELSKVLAARVGATLFGAGEKDERGGEPSRRERLADLRLTGCLLGQDPNALLLFDEMDDLLSRSAPNFFSFGLMLSEKNPSDGSKLFLNRLLEENAAPIIWITNHARRIDPAFLRRMTSVVHLGKPPTRVRERILARQLDKNEVRVDEEHVAQLARRFELPPGVAEGPIRAAALVPEGDRQAMLERGLRNIADLMGGEQRVQAAPARFDPAFIQADQDLVDLAGRLTGEGAKPLSMCLYGPPGTGKSAYARYLAERMGLEVLHKRTSDLLDMYVGESEKNIAKAFREARDARSFLIFDEADSLLADRHGAVRTWEVTQVNEMLTQMEAHPLPFACTTNYAEKLDEATKRRFLFKVRLGYSSPEQAAGLFRAYFGMDAPGPLWNLQGLAPGDFPVVRRKAEITGQLDDAAALAAMLKAECDAKSSLPKGIGFSAAEA